MKQFPVLLLFALCACVFPDPCIALGRGASATGISVHFGQPWYSRPYAGMYHGYPRHHYRRYRGGSFFGLGVDLYPFRPYESGRIAPARPSEHNLGQLPGQSPPQTLPREPAANPAATDSSDPPVVYPVMTHESREAWVRWESWRRTPWPPEKKASAGKIHP